MDDFGGNMPASLALDVSSMLYECFAFVRTQDARHIEICSAYHLTLWHSMFKNATKSRRIFLRQNSRPGLKMSLYYFGKQNFN